MSFLLFTMRHYRDSFVWRKSERSFKGHMSPSSKILKHVFQILKSIRWVIKISHSLNVSVGLRWLHRSKHVYCNECFSCTFMTSSSQRKLTSFLNLWDFFLSYLWLQTDVWRVSWSNNLLVCNYLNQPWCRRDALTGRSFVFGPTEMKIFHRQFHFLQTALIIWNYFPRWINRHAVL